MTRQRRALHNLVDTARRMLAGDVGPIEGSRVIERLHNDVGAGDDSVIDPFRGINAQSDDFLVGDRSLWAQAYLDEIDRRYAAFDAVLRLEIASDCEALLAAFEPKLFECPACGFAPLMAMPWNATGEPSCEECSCCEFQPGVTDEIEYDVAEWRRRWIADGMPFRRPPAPADWDPTACSLP
jgi:hypothetical protein